MAEGAGLAVGFDVGRFGADAERHRHLADGVAQVISVEEPLDAGTAPIPAAVDLESGEQVDGSALSFLGDPVVALGGG